MLNSAEVPHTVQGTPGSNVSERGPAGTLRWNHIHTHLHTGGHQSIGDSSPQGLCAVSHVFSKNAMVFSHRLLY